MRMFMLMGIIVMGIYVLPSVTAKFTGSHTMEVNQSGVRSMSCGNCHQYIANELNLSDGSLSDYVVDQHITALKNANYANASNTSAPLAIDSISGATIDEVCMLCHQVQSGVSGGHTNVTIRACTDVVCHGYNSSANITLAYTNQNITEKLSSTSDAHSVWYNAMTDGSPYKAEDVNGRAGDIANQTAVNSSGYYTVSFYTCLGCHTHVGIDFSPITRWRKFTINVTFGTSGSATVSFINMTDSNATYTSKDPGTVW
jgi:cytochrome c2